MEINEKLEQLLKSIREKKPLVHHITNYVTVNDCANIVLAMGGSPVMADAIEEAADMVSIASALVINIGTLNKTTVESMIMAGKKANELGIPVILDPVGIGATPYRMETALNLIKEINFTVIRGNMAEIKTLCGMNAQSKGVDSEELQSEDGKEVVKKLAVQLNTVVAITGATDYISDGSKVIILKNGHRMLADVTGTGCMSTSLIGTCCGAGKDYLLAAAAGIMAMGIAGEIAYEKLKASDGNGSYKAYILDAIYNYSFNDVINRGKLYEE